MSTLLIHRALPEDLNSPCLHSVFLVNYQAVCSQASCTDWACKNLWHNHRRGKGKFLWEGQSGEEESQPQTLILVFFPILQVHSYQAPYTKTYSIEN